LVEFKSLVYQKNTDQEISRLVTTIMAVIYVAGNANGTLTRHCWTMVFYVGVGEQAMN